MGFGNSKAVQATANWRNVQRSMDRRKCENPARRNRYEKDTAKWLKYYLSGAYPADWGKMHLDIIAGAEKAVETGGKFGVAAPRGTGKSSVLWGVALKMLFMRKVRFPVILPWAAKDQRKTLRFWKTALCFNARLAADYPEFCQPFEVSGGSSMKCMTLLWSDTGKPAGAELRMSDGMMIFPDGLGAIGSATINGNPRGLNHTTKTGEVLRPDLCLIDDPQDKEVSKSPTLVAATIDVIDTDVLGMAGPEGRMPALLACTVMRRGDVSEHYIKSQGWDFMVVPQIVTWPTNRKLWDDLGAMLLENREKDALKFYKEHKAELSEGLTVSWAGRYDRKRGEPDACYSAMRDFYTMGESSFMSERQNEPIETSTSSYEITQSLVLSRVNGFQRLSVPEHVEWIVAAADVNYVGINWVVLAATKEGAVYCPAYGCFTAGRARLFDPKRQAKQLESAAIQSGCISWMNEINRLAILVGDKPQHVQIAGIDCGKWPELIIPAAYSVRLPVKVVPVRGTSASKYRVQKEAVQFGEGWHVSKWKLGRVVAINADFYKETAQRSFLAEPGSAGSISLYQPQHKTEHQALADEICGERLEEHVQTPTNDFYKWTHRPGARWDKLDAMTYARALLSVVGLSSSGVELPRRMQKNRRATIQMVGI